MAVLAGMRLKGVLAFFLLGFGSSVFSLGVSLLVGVGSGLGLGLELDLDLDLDFFLDLDFLGGGVLAESESESEEEEEDEEVDEEELEEAVAFMGSLVSSVALESVDVFLLVSPGRAGADGELAVGFLADLGLEVGARSGSRLELLSDDEEEEDDAGGGICAASCAESNAVLSGEGSGPGAATAGVELVSLLADASFFLAFFAFFSALVGLGLSTGSSSADFLSPLSAFTFFSTLSALTFFSPLSALTFFSPLSAFTFFSPLSGLTFLSAPAFLSDLVLSEVASSLAFFARGLSSLATLSVESEAALRFSLLMRLLTVGFGEGTLTGLVSFSSSASLSELDDGEDAEEDAFLPCFAPCAGGASFISTSPPKASSLLDSLPLLLVCSSSTLIFFSLGFALLWIIFSLLVAASSSSSLVMSSALRSSHSFNQSLYIFKSLGVPFSSFPPNSSAHPLSFLRALRSVVNMRHVLLKPYSVRKTAMRLSSCGSGGGLSGTP